MTDSEKKPEGFFVKTAGRIVSLIRQRPTLYYYVPPCPECGSRITGRYVRQPFTSNYIRYVKDESLKHGELVRLVPSVPFDNAFCETCGHEWPENVYARIMPACDVEEEKRLRGTAGRYAEFQEKNPKKRPIWRKFTGFFS